MLKHKCGPHIAAIAALVMFVVLGLACESTPSYYSNGSSDSSSDCRLDGACVFAGSASSGGAYIWCQDTDCAIATKDYSTCDC